MFGPPPGTRVYLACGTTDMRKGFDGLAAQVQTVLAQDPYSGAVFCFRGRRGDLVKILLWDGQGLVLVAKRLEKGQLRVAAGDQRCRLPDTGHAVDAVGRHRLAHASLDGTARSGRITPSLFAATRRGRRRFAVAPELDTRGLP